MGDGGEGQWFPLAGVKTGEVLLSADFLDDLGRNPSDILPSLLRGDDVKDPLEHGDRKRSGEVNRKLTPSGIPSDSGRKIDKEDIPKGVAYINLIKAKELIKSDMVGKSDPYAILSYGKQKDKTKVIKNTQEPQWNHKTKFNVPDGDSRTFKIEVFDSDKIGKDKSLGKLSLDLTDVLTMNKTEGKWFPLDGVKSGKVLLSSDFIDELGRKPSDILPSLTKTPEGHLSQRKPSDIFDHDRQGLPEGLAKIHLVKAKELIKTDVVGKSDPYAVLVHGRQIQKTKTIKNTLEPEWNHTAEFNVPDGDSRNFYIEVFDSDKIGKDKSLGKLNLDITDVFALDGQEGRWFPLAGVKSGQVLLSAEFIDKLGRNLSISTISSSEVSRLSLSLPLAIIATAVSTIAISTISSSEVSRLSFSLSLPLSIVATAISITTIAISSIATISS